MADVGRPPIPLDWDLIEQLTQAHCNGVEIAARLRIDTDTLYNRVKEKYGMNFSCYSAKFQGSGKALLRQQQFNKALNTKSSGNVQMLMWLGKQLLGQKETKEDLNIDENTLKQFENIMKMMKDSQDLSPALNIDDNSNIIDSQS